MHINDHQVENLNNPELFPDVKLYLKNNNKLTATKRPTMIT